MDTKKPVDDNQIGSLWVKTGAKGEWLSGNVLGQNVVVFRNSRKPEGSNQPDFRILKARPKPDATATRAKYAEAQAARGPVTDDEIQF